MAIARSQGSGSWVLLSLLKSFLVWMLILEVCFLVIGFPVVTVITAGAAVAAIALLPLMPINAVLFVVSVVIGANLLGVTLLSTGLTLKGVYPHEVSWLGWLNQEASANHVAIYAACPLTCDVHSAVLRQV
ncbi:MAG: hypothetical protein HC886_19855 [Leptolyngbyaceae cyanobacterium SM1_1_3]|nr:hypothetical protein [Leptolyngbyaceae cyanobacterium SM1_1_3]NJM85122.1 hypothetical protein [Leptolyngbyaceae cyanobacterium RM2_2_21]NJN02894.1 hypothetical protein [Leptolyngbyaceae cyanobacterium RM1_1_2]NJO11719.1 hypothetical protein [Leptolyngbyaceae cyanobacterium SL_1_1]